MKPILFNTEMVMAILDGRKTATRRLVKNKDIINNWDCEADGTLIAYIDRATGNSYPPTFPCPYHPGDILYVRETWGWNYCYDCGMTDGGLDIVDLNDGHIESDPFRCYDETAERVFFEKENEYGCYCYKASAEAGEIPDGDGRWHPSIHMPKEAARLFLRVTGVRVERLQQISNQDIIREGVNPRWTNGGCHCTAYQSGCLDEPCPNRDAYEWSCHVTSFSELWDSTIPKKDLDRYGWDANPWVWVIEFERISKEDLR